MTTLKNCFCSREIFDLEFKTIIKDKDGVRRLATVSFPNAYISQPEMVTFFGGPYTEREVEGSLEIPPNVEIKISVKGE